MLEKGISLVQNPAVLDSTGMRPITIP